MTDGVEALVVEADFDGNTYGLCYWADDLISIYRGEEVLGESFWNLRWRRVAEYPESVPEPIRGALDQRLRIEILGQSISKEELRRRPVPWQSLEKLFEAHGVPALPEGCTRWAKFRARNNIYTVLVVRESSGWLFRNWRLVGKATWSVSLGFTEYLGEHIPPNVWAALTLHVAEFGQYHSFAKRSRPRLARLPWPKSVKGR